MPKLFLLILFVFLYGNSRATGCDLSINLGIDTSICNGDSLFLTTGFSPDTASFLWSTGDTLASIWATAEEMYSVTVTTPSGCGTDTISLMLKPTPTASLAVDNTCLGTSTLFNLAYTALPQATISWDLGDNTILDSVTNNLSYAYEILESIKVLLRLTI